MEGIKKLGNSIEQSHNTVSGDIVGRDKITIQTITSSKARRAIRLEEDFFIVSDEDNSTLFRKLHDGKTNGLTKARAVTSKLNSLKIIFQLKKSEEGKRLLADIYENLLTCVSKVTLPMEDGDLLKYKSEDIFSQFPSLISRYEDIIEIDEAFLEGLLYIATSNCAIRWKVE
ncbi:hypothetical protein [Paenibacillus sp. OK003]|uniref:hypothetical protein n=1 Tax=Paenibacillus sp. OK003 TaxID=1884380 RepID=UPI0008B3CDDE|nr:hypothetical protein [Paenibacillus sp. OK003]SEL85378.1 hypothetical protein SAMN05518856_12090 [Paenibacillus sp. OK003]